MGLNDVPANIGVEDVEQRIIHPSFITRIYLQSGFHYQSMVFIFKRINGMMIQLGKNVGINGLPMACRDGKGSIFLFPTFK